MFVPTDPSAGVPQRVTIIHLQLQVRQGDQGQEVQFHTLWRREEPHNIRIPTGQWWFENSTTETPGPFRYQSSFDTELPIMREPTGLSSPGPTGLSSPLSSPGSTGLSSPEQQRVASDPPVVPGTPPGEDLPSEIPESGLRTPAHFAQLN